jgi:hypothetical protein
MGNLPDVMGADEIVHAILAPRSKEELVKLVSQARGGEGRVTVSWRGMTGSCAHGISFPSRRGRSSRISSTG